MSRRLFAVIIALCVLGSIFLVLRKPITRQAVEQPFLKPIMTFVVQKTKIKQDTILQQIRAVQDGLHEAKLSEETESIAWVKKTTIAFNAMHALYDYVSKDTVRREIIDELRKDPETIPLTQKILTNNTWARKMYGKDQAVARVYAISVLEREAEENGPRILHDTAQSLSAVLARNEQISKGEKADLEDLLYAYAKQESPEAMMANFPRFVAKLTVHPNTASAIRDGFYFGLMGRVKNQEQMRQMILWHVR
ncbi:MAG: hypothetical protein WCK42_06205 [Myxococcaceae bacterium]